jgi:hypothetical protein
LAPNCAKPGTAAGYGAGLRGRYDSPMATRDELHRRVDSLSEPELERARIVIVDEVSPDTSVEAILARQGDKRLSDEEFDQHFGHLPTDGEG